MDRMQYIDAHDTLLLKSLKLLHILRTSVCRGNRILNDIDNITRKGLSIILNLPFSDENGLEAKLPVKDGCLSVCSIASLVSSASSRSSAPSQPTEQQYLEIHVKNKHPSTKEPLGLIIIIIKPLV